MQNHEFFPRRTRLTVGAIAGLIGAEAPAGPASERSVSGVSTLVDASVDDLSFCESARYLESLAASEAGCVIVSPKLAAQVPDGAVALVVQNVAAAFAIAGRALFPDAILPAAAFGASGVSTKAEIHPGARLEEEVTVEPFAVIGPNVAIGRGTIVGAGSVIASGVQIGRNCRIGANVTISHALIGNAVIIHPGCRIGQDGFGYTAGAQGLLKSVQVGRVIVQDGVELGSNSTIDRGAIRDTVIGEGTKIDNQVQIGHNVQVGRHCAIAAQVGISGSAVIGDGVMMGGQAGVNSHSTIGDRAQIAGTASIAGDVPARGRWGGTPARPIRQWFRELTILSEMAMKKPPQGNDDER